VSPTSSTITSARRRTATDVLRVALTDASGAGLASGLRLSISAWPYTMEDLEKATT
jgi:hypothetical protein